MKDYIKTLDEIKKMRVAGKLASDVLMMIKDYVKPGISTGELIEFAMTILWIYKKQFLLH
jgi:methionine aminopeptidase